jgi:hypothetical protein
MMVQQMNIDFGCQDVAFMFVNILNQYFANGLQIGAEYLKITPFVELNKSSACYYGISGFRSHDGTDAHAVFFCYDGTATISKFHIYASYNVPRIRCAVKHKEYDDIPPSFVDWILIWDDCNDLKDKWKDKVIQETASYKVNIQANHILICKMLIDRIYSLILEGHKFYSSLKINGELVVMK